MPLVHKWRSAVPATLEGAGFVAQQGAANTAATLARAVKAARAARTGPDEMGSVEMVGLRSKQASVEQIADRCVRFAEDWGKCKG